jgi:branched-chain amino acid transport system permease protein
VPVDRLIVVVIALAALAGFYVFIRHTRAGLAMRAAAQDLEAAETQGVNTGAPTRSPSSWPSCWRRSRAPVGPDLRRVAVPGRASLLMAFIVVILGGMGSIPGAALGARCSASPRASSAPSTVRRSAFLSFGVVIGLLVVRPWGILGAPGPR